MQRLIGMVVGSGSSVDNEKKSGSSHDVAVSGAAAAGGADQHGGKMGKKKAKKEMKKTLDAAFNPDNFDNMEDNNANLQ